jgi:glycosyltransferase involved in cell wall biosynthesis
MVEGHGPKSLGQKVLGERKNQLPFVLNCSRVDLKGGLKTFSDEIMGAMVEAGLPCRAVVPVGYKVPAGVEAVFTPAYLASVSHLSLLRPLKWLFYSRFHFPIPADQKVLSTTHQVLPNRSRQIVTIHDIRPYFFPDTRLQQFYFRTILPRALARCDGILTVSESSRELIADTYRISLDRIAVVPNSVRLPSSVSRPVEVGCYPYLLVVGASWAHKNVEAFLLQHRIWATSYKLKIVGGKTPYRDSLTSLVLTLGIADRVEFLSDIGAEQLDRLYRECSAVIYPSKMEGFGLPPLEAMARLRPVIVSDLPVFRETYGPHAVYVNLDREESWEQAFRQLPHLDDAFFARAQAHAQTFTRGRMATCLMAALRRFWSLDIGTERWNG